MTNSYYILEGKKIVQVEDILTWGTFYSKISKRRVGSDNIQGVSISTVFLGIDHNFSSDGPPVLFETMSFGKILSPECILYRYCTYNAAYNTHRRLVKLVNGLFNLPIDQMPIYINNKDFRGEIALHRLKRGY